MFQAGFAHHQEVLLCIYGNWYVSCVYVDWLLAGSCQQPDNIMLDYTNCCLYWVDPPDHEHQACLKHVEYYYW